MPCKPDLLQRLLHLVELERLDDGLDLLHRVLTSRAVRKRDPERLVLDSRVRAKGAESAEFLAVFQRLADFCGNWTGPAWNGLLHND